MPTCLTLIVFLEDIMVEDVKDCNIKAYKKFLNYLVISSKYEECSHIKLSSSSSRTRIFKLDEIKWNEREEKYQVSVSLRM